MAVHDRWFLAKRGPNGERQQSQQHGRGKRWRVRYTDDTGRSVDRLFAKKSDADAFDAMVRADLARGTYINSQKGQTLFKDYMVQWQANQIHRPSTQVLADTHLRNHVLPLLGTRPLKTIKHTDLQLLVRTLTSKLAPTTVEMIYRYVSSIFRTAVADGELRASPCAGIRLPKAPREEIAPLPTAAVLAWAKAMPARFQALVDLGAGSGLRSGEMFGLEVEKIDFLRRLIKVDQQLVLINGAPPYIGPLKTPAAYRTVPVGKVVIEKLAAHLAVFPPIELEILDNTGVRPVTRSARFVFTSARNLAIRRPTITNNVIRPALVRAQAALLGRSPTDESRALAASLDGTGLHALRHYYVSLLISHGYDAKEVQLRLGHAKASETWDTYTHLWPRATTSDDRRMAAIDLVLAGDLLGEDDGLPGQDASLA